MKLDLETIKHMVQRALLEDLGDGDITSELTINPSVQGEMVFNAREKMVVCGMPVVKEVITQIDNSVSVTELVNEGNFVNESTNLMRVAGSARSILAFERVALNFMQHMSAMATVSHAYAKEVEGTKAVVLDTRKTLPNLRHIAKYAVAIGGCENHRIGLYDGILIKDNHIHVVGGITNAVVAAQQGNNRELPIEIECDTLAQAAEAIEAKADILLLDNMTNNELREAVRLRGNKPIKLEASGGVTLNTIGEIARTGVDYISVGALTHSAGNMDIGLDSA